MFPLYLRYKQSACKVTGEEALKGQNQNVKMLTSYINVSKFDFIPM